MMTFFDAKSKSCKVLDARETAPKASTRDMYGADEWASKYGRRKNEIKLKSIFYNFILIGFFILTSKYDKKKYKIKINSNQKLQLRILQLKHKKVKQSLRIKNNSKWMK